MRTIEEMMTLPDGAIALVTGGTGWLGSAISEALVELGARVVSLSRQKSEQFDAGCCETYQLDLDDYGSYLEKKVTDFLTYLGDDVTNVKVLVNNMCVWPKQHDFFKSSASEIEASINANLSAQLYFTQRVADLMSSGSSIINVASMYGKVSPDQKMYRGTGGNALMYGVAKAGLIQATKYLAGQLGPKGIRVNSISPGPFSRPGSLDGKDWFREELNNRTMLGRIADREELKGVIALLATDLGSYVTGVDIPVDGGWTAW